MEDIKGMFYWFIKECLLGPIIKIFYRPKVEGLDNIPNERGAILASNHLSFSDSIFLPIVLPRPVIFFTKSDYFYSPGILGILKAKFFKMLDQIPIDRRGGLESNSQSFKSAEELLVVKGGLLGIYPEGTRSSDGKLHKGKTGVARIALKSKVSVIPVAMINTDIVQPIGSLFPDITPRIIIKIGKPINFSTYYGQHNDPHVLRHITNKIMESIANLSGQDYVDEYSKPATKRLAKNQEIIRN